MRRLSKLAVPSSLLAGSLAALAVALAPARADACGGTFCDSGPMAMPVDQTGENILFVLGDDEVQAHIQINIDPNTDAEQFAWVIPVLQVPEFEVGSDPFFQNLLAGSVPTYGYNTVNEPCGDSTSDGDGWGDEGDTTDGTTDGDTGGEEPPNVVLEESVGAFDIVVLQGGTIESVMQWLGDNGYQQDPAAEPILGEYLDEGYLFVALKLGVDVGVEAVHPIVLRYQGDEPCVPVRLTRIAASEDMDIRTFVLGNGRAVPTNYRHVLVNPLKIDWINFAANYKEVISMAVDAFAADGNAFVTEYAGGSDVVPLGGILGPLWDATPIAAVEAIDVVPLLEEQGLAECGQGLCEFTHPLLPGLMQTYLPVPDGLEPAEFYGCVACFAGLIDEQAWDAAALAADIDDRIIAPGERAVGLLADHPYLSRLYTTISPNEMFVDPIFHINASLPDVPRARQGTRFIPCEGPATFTLPDGREVYLPNSNQWPNFTDEMPWEEDVEQAAMVGPNQILSDQTELIDALLAEWNEQNGPGGGGSGDGGESGEDGESGEAGEDAGSADDFADDGTGSAGAEAGDGSASCACSTDGSGAGGGGPFGLLALAGLGLLIRRRTRA